MEWSKVLVVAMVAAEMRVTDGSVFTKGVYVKKDKFKRKCSECCGHNLTNDSGSLFKVVY